MRRRPPLHLVEVALDRVSVAGLAVLEAGALAHADLKRKRIAPFGGFGQSHHDIPVGIGPDRLLHRVPGDEEPVERMRVKDVDSPDGGGGVFAAGSDRRDGSFHTY